MSRVLLTGASGFVGRHALPALVARGHEVHAVARTRGPDADGVAWHEADLLASAQVVEDVRPDVLVHLAWYAEHGKFWTSTENVRWVEASLALVRAFVRADGRRAVMAGSCAEYEWSSRERYDERAPTRPSTLYGAAKHGLHVVCDRLMSTSAVELAWARLFFLYGPGEDAGRFVPSIVGALLRGEPAPMTEGSQRRDFMHAADAGAAIAALASGSVVGAVNVASGAGVSLLDVGQAIARTIGREDLLQPGAMPVRAEEPSALVADVSRLRDEVGWSPHIPLNEGLRDVIGWWRERQSSCGREHASGDG